MDEPENNSYVRDSPLDFQEPEAMAESDAKEQVENLREAIEYHDYRYYVENNPVIADRAYDQLFDRLETLEQAFDLVAENSPTQRVAENSPTQRVAENSPTQRVGGEPMDELETRKHVTEMLSLDSSEDEEEVREFDERVRDTVGDVTYSAEPKFDGFSIEIVYEDGEFDRAVTRGDGESGEDISENIKTIRTVPLRVPEAPELLAVRAEVYMPKSGFQDLNERRVQEGKDPFANPRNAAAGTVRQLDPQIVAERPLDVYFYDIMDTSQQLTTQEEVFEVFSSLGFRLNEYNRTIEGIDTFVTYREELLDQRDDLEYDIDGVVAKVSDFDKQETLGETARHPRWAFAYKFPAKTGETTVQRITVQVGRTGKLTPIALLDPVDVAGVTISRATLHNEQQAQDLGIGESTTVRIERAGDVIPQVQEVVDSSDSVFEMPEQCPVCGSDVVQEGPNHFCSGGMSCDAQLRRSLEHFASRGAMDIDELGEKIADTLVEESVVESIADLYTLEKDDLTALSPFGDQSAENLLTEIEASKEINLASFLYALGIRHVGKERARILADQFSLDKLQEADSSELQTVGDIGDEVATSIHSFFENEQNRETIQRLQEAGVTPGRRERGDEFEGVTMVLTGSIEGYSRDELTELLEHHGADVTSSVSSETDYLIVGEEPGSTKMEEAEELDVETIDDADFKERFLTDLAEVPQ